MSDSPALRSGDVLRISLSDGTAALVQVVAVEPRAVALSVADVIWDCAPGALDWQNAGRALLHLAVRPAALADAVHAGHAEVAADALEAHARWRTAREVTAAPLAVVIQALLAP